METFDFKCNQLTSNLPTLLYKAQRRYSSNGTSQDFGENANFGFLFHSKTIKTIMYFLITLYAKHSCSLMSEKCVFGISVAP